MSVTKVQMTHLGAQVPQQVDAMIEIVRTLSKGQIPSPEGVITSSTNKKDVIGYILWLGCRNFLQSIGVLDSFASSWSSKEEDGIKFNHNLYGSDLNKESEEAKKSIENILEGINATQDIG